jgi:hypothetical protein
LWRLKKEAHSNELILRKKGIFSRNFGQCCLLEMFCQKNMATPHDVITISRTTMVMGTTMKVEKTTKICEGMRI